MNQDLAELVKEGKINQEVAEAIETLPQDDQGRFTDMAKELPPSVMLDKISEHLEDLR